MGSTGYLRRLPAGLLRWPIAAASFAVAVCAAEAAYGLTASPERYTQFTTGSLAWRAAGKRADYFLLLGLVAGFAVAWIGLLLLDRRVEQQMGARAALRARGWLAYACLPLILWIAGQLIFPAGGLALLKLSAASVVAVVATVVLMVRAHRRKGERTEFIVAVDAVLVAGILAATAALVVPFALNRLAVLFTNRPLVRQVPSLEWLVVGGLAVVSFVAWLAFRDLQRVPRRLAGLLVGTQAVVAWGFLCIVPSPLDGGAVWMYPLPVTRAFLLAFALVAIAYGDLFLRSRTIWRSAGAFARPLDVISPFALAGALLFVRQRPVALGMIPTDDYHFGESLLPWWSYVSAHSIPFWDHTPSRGLTDYAEGALSALIFDGSATGVMATEAVLAALLLVLVLWALGAFIGPLPALVALLPLPISDQLSQIDAVNTALLAVLFLAYGKTAPHSWLWLWGLAAMATFVWAPAQGAALIMATSPLALVRAHRVWRDGWRPGWTRLALFVSALLMLALLTPLGRVVVGAARYAAEHSEVAGPAHALEWALSAGSHGTVSRWLWEGVRTSWIGVAFCGIALISSRVIGRRRRSQTLLVVAVPVVLLALIFIYRAAGRINPGSVTRLGIASIWMLSLLLPMLLRAAWGLRRWPTTLAVSTFGAGLLVPGLAPFDLDAIRLRALDAVHPPAVYFDGTKEDMPNVGRVGVDAGQAGRLRSIRRVLQALLDKDETYLDLTNRNAQYFYLGRKVPVESGAFYNLPNDRQQLRAIHDLERNRVPVVLAWADSELWDGGPPSYRTYAIYRYLVWRYVPVRVERFIYLIKPDRIPRLDRLADLPMEREPGPLLDAVFRVEDLQGLPASWGASWKDLSQQAEVVRLLGDVQSVSNTFTWDLGPQSLSGRDAGILTFDCLCGDASGTIQLELSWAAAEHPPDESARLRFLVVPREAVPRVAVPLDAAPRWLLAPSIGVLRLRVLTPERCPRLSVRRAALWQRRIVAATDPN